jgi:hypothetical protein
VKGKVETLLGLREGDPEGARDGDDGYGVVGHTSAVAYSVEGESAMVEEREELGTCSAVTYTLSALLRGSQRLRGGRERRARGSS